MYSLQLNRTTEQRNKFSFCSYALQLMHTIFILHKDSSTLILNKN